MKGLGDLGTDRGEEEGNEVVLEEVWLEVDLHQLETGVRGVEVEGGFVEGFAVGLRWEAIRDLVRPRSRCYPLSRCSRCCAHSPPKSSKSTT